MRFVLISASPLMRSFSLFPKTSLMRQECLEHDQRIVALVSMVRHIEVRLKQQQQQSVGRSLLALEDTIRQTEVRRGEHLPEFGSTVLFPFNKTV